MTLRVGTRGSLLARAQASVVLRRLEALGRSAELVIVQTAGDRQRERKFAEIGPHGIFVAEIETALLTGRIDLAVHSCKDLPSESPEGLRLAAIPERLDPADLLLCRSEAHEPRAEELPLRAGARVGTASARRAALLRALRSDIDVVHLRGNVPTRVRRLREDHYDAILLAAAGVRRLASASIAGQAEPLSLDGLITWRLDPETFVPAPGQGAIAIQARAVDGELCDLLRELDDGTIHRAVCAEREMLRLVEAGCQVPFGAWCSTDVAELRMVAVLERNGRLQRVAGRGEDPTELARALARRLQGGESTS